MIRTPLLLPLCFLLGACATAPRHPDRVDDCTNLAVLSAAGEHKAAVEKSRAMRRELSSCPNDVRKAVSTSYGILNKADSLVRQSFARRKRGDLLGARGSLQKALAVYPRYYWVQKLLRGVEKSFALRLGALREEASYLEARGDLLGSANRIREALALAPEDVSLHDSLSRIEDRKSQREARQMARRSLERARDLLTHGRFEEAESAVRDSQALALLEAEAGRVLTRIRKGKAGHAREEFARARRAAEAKDFEKALFHLRVASREGESEGALREEMTQWARVQGMHCYSKGELTRARKIWLAALEIDPENPTLLKYVSEVELRLDSLAKIREQRQDRRPAPDR